MQHTERTHTNTEHNMQHNQDTENTETEHKIQHTDTDTNNPAENSTHLNTENSAHNYRTYSFDIYHEYVAIKNSNTIELYTILQDKI